MVSLILHHFNNSLLYRNLQLFWTGGAEDPPAPFGKIRDDLFDPDYGWLTTRFIRPFHVAFVAGDEAVAILWQQWLDDYANTSFYTAVIERMTVCIPCLYISLYTRIFENIKHLILVFV